MFSIRHADLLDIAFLPVIEAAADTILTSIDGKPLPMALPAGPPRGELAAALKLLVAGRPCVGFARVEELDGAAHLEQLSVLPHRAGQGIGRGLVEASKDWSREHGYTSMTLSTFAEVPFNCPFYETCGFEVVEDLSPALLGLREHELIIGLDRIGRRVIMRATL
ncbi:GNAT family N-acetyltransferase [Arthrobacter sp. H20]|uniref:GNAT family N-acetyltransferase n=1 Tax=Arthrobacter sp. H20 TaxID=1267981 RepID=UPI0004BB70B3|nr:GNAT family N-acetyltransferase [Arthrobacter sp. H20]